MELNQMNLLNQDSTTSPFDAIKRSDGTNEWAQFLSSTGDVSVNEAARALSRNSAHIVGERRLRSLMESWNWIYRDCKRKPRAYQTQIDNGRLAERAGTYQQDLLTGELVQAAPQVRVTAKGLDAARDLLSMMDR